MHFKKNLLKMSKPESLCGLLGEKLLCFYRNVPNRALGHQARHSSFRK
jgi:hypothetical protein